MFHALLTLASEGAEPSKTAYYIGAGVLIGWAVLLGAIGMMQPEFPRSGGAARGVMGISSVLTVVALVTVLVTA